MTRPILLLSPHFDDGALSCGGTLGCWARGGREVAVVTLFAGASPGPVPPFGAVQHRMWGSPPAPNRLRRAEDHAAYLRLGIEKIHHLEVPDAVYRGAAAGGAYYDSEAAIFGPVRPEERDLAAEIVARLAPLIRARGRILAPLGAGGHVDHRIARRVGERLAAAGRSVTFYEELPYVESPGALDSALGERERWRPQILRLDPQALEAKIAAVAYYRTQIPVLYGDERQMEHRVRAVALDAGGGRGYAERLWWPRKGGNGDG